MPLSNDLISQFVKITKDKTKDTRETIVYGTVQDSKAPNGLNYVKIDGSDLLTPVLATTVVSPQDRVTIMIKNHSAVVTGNLTSPAARSADTIDVYALAAQIARIDNLETIDADVQGRLTANIADINDLKASTATISGNLSAAEADIDNLQADTATINGKLTAAEADIDDLQANTLTASQIAATYATIENLDVEKGRIDALESTSISAEVVSATYATITSLNAEKGRIDTLETTKLSAADIEGLYANIDFSNISKATMGQFYANSGLIQNVVVGDSTITGKLVGVTISGDLIEGNTVKAEKLVIKGTDGLYYKLNTDGVTTEAEQTNQNSLDGSVIKAKSVTASKVNVTDLVAFGATIGGFTITDSDLYSGVKSSAINTTRGIYLGKDAQAAIGDGTSYIKYYKDSNGAYKLDISADSITLTSGGDVETQMNQLSDSVETNSEDLAAYVTATNNKFDELQGQIDGSIMTWFYEYVPTNSNVPASQWTTTDLKNNHLGDLFYNTLTGYCYRWQVRNNEYSWNRITDVDVTKALSDAAAAQDTADKKRRVFTTTPTTPYDVGDLWAQGTSGELMRCKTAKTSSQNYAAADWEKASKYTDDTKANAAKTAADAAQADADALKARMTSAETSITQNSEQIALRATKTEVTTAKEAAISAAATDATNKANALKPSITEAKKAGTDAQSDVDALTTRVTAAETSITQNADAIALRATKTEVNAIKTTADAAATQLSTKGLNKAVVDLLDTTTYSTDMYYPVVGTTIPYTGYHTFEINNQLEANSAPSWSTHTNKGFTCNISVRMLASGWGTTKAEVRGWIDLFSYNFCDKMPAYVGQMWRSSFPVFYLRGGGKYYIYSDYKCTWNVKTETYTNSSESVAPTASPENDSQLVNNWTNNTRLKTAETSIKQNSDAIALCATKNELSALDTRVTSAESSITILANSIASNVTETTNLGTRTTTIEQTADGLTARISTAEGNITTAQNTANTAKTNAATAQETANTAKTNAATAQTTADTAKTNAATAQSTANTAKTNAATAQTTANTALARTTVKDTREDNNTPAWYMTNYPKQTVVEFKKSSVLGLSGHTYCTLETVVPWNDKSGGYPKQTATVNEKQYWRTGSSDTAWGAWTAASETATNFLSFDTTNGVLIGNKTSGSWSGTRAQITGSAFNILDTDGTILSSYGSTTTIGKTAANNIYIDGDGVKVRKNGKVLATFDQYGLKIANTNDSSGSLGSGTTKPALVIGTPTAYHIEMDNNEIMAKSNATTSSHLFLNMEGGNVSVNNNANRAFMFQEGALYAKNSSFNSGEYLGIIDALNDAGNTTFGYGGYLKKIGGTNIYGNSISLVSNGNVDVEASWINCRSITPSANATYALGTYGEKGWSNIYLGKGDGKTNALHIISGSSTYTLCGVNSSGQYIFGNNAAVMYYQVKNVHETDTGNAFKVTSGNNTAANNTSSVWFFGAADATSRYIGSYLAYNRTYSSAANMVVTTNGIFGRSTSSSERYKKDIQLADINELKGLYDLPVKRFKYKEDYIASDDELYDKDLYGFIAEDLENVLPCAVQHKKDTDGTVKPEMWNSNIIIPSLLKLIQDLNNRLKTLEEKENNND